MYNFYYRYNFSNIIKPKNKENPTMNFRAKLTDYNRHTTFIENFMFSLNN